MEKSDSLGTKSHRKPLWDYLGGRRSKQTRRNSEEFSAECHSVDCSGDSKVLTELKIHSNKIEVIVLDDQKSRELRRTRTMGLAVYLYNYANANMVK